MVKIKEVCGGVITTHPWCHVELQWCDFVRVSLPPGVVRGGGCYRVPCLSEVIHVLASRSWWGCKGEEWGGRATAAHWRGEEGVFNGLPGEMGRGLKQLLKAVDFELLLLGQVNLQRIELINKNGYWQVDWTYNLKWALHKGEKIYIHIKIFNKTYLNKELADILALISLKLDHFTILWVLNHCPIAGKLLLKVKR